MKIVYIVAGVLIAIVFIGWLGFQIKPAHFSTLPLEEGTVETMPLPEGLPEPVERYYREIYGDEIPVITSVVIGGRAQLRINGIPMKGRYRFTHIAGQGYRHFIDVTWFGVPLLKVNERYLDGVAYMETPFGTSEGEIINQSANQGLWAECIWLPAILLTDERVVWETVDAETAILVVPMGNDVQRFTVRFDPQTGLVQFFESMRYKTQEDPVKYLWINEVGVWGEVNGYQVPNRGAVTWFDEGKAWAVFEVEELVYNADVSEYIRARGK
jgi:Family of unknown function (DUF6544)